MLWQPWKVAMLGIAAWLFVWLTAPLRYLTDLDMGAMGYIALCYLAFFAGGWSVGQYDPVKRSWVLGARQAPPSRLFWTWRPGVFWVAVVIGSIGIVARYYDLTVLRQVDLTAGYETRGLMEDNQGGGFAAVAALLQPVALIPLMLVLLVPKLKGHYLHLAIAITLFVVPATMNVLMLSRSTMLTSLVLAYFVYCLIREGGRVASKRVLIPALAGVVALGLLSSVIFQERLGGMRMDFLYSIHNSVYAHTVNPTPEVSREIASGGTFLSGFYSTNIANQMYYVHGVYEFSILWNRPDDQPFAYGTYLMTPYTKAFSVIFDVPMDRIYDEDKLLVRTGAFMTFFGPFWVDFGWVGPLIMFLFGFGLTLLSEYVKRGAVNWMPLYIYSMVIIFFMPVVNLMISALGIYILSTFVIFGVFTGFSQPSARANSKLRPVAGGVR